MRLPLPYHSYKHKSPPGAAMRLVNAYAETVPPENKGPVLLSRAPGLRAFGTAGTAHRNAHVMRGQLYAVSGSALYRIDATGTALELGSIAATGRVDMADNGTELVIVAPPHAYVYNRDTETLSQITDTDFVTRGASTCAFLDSYMLFNEPGTGRFFASELAAATDYTALNFATAEGAPDDTLCVRVDHRQLLVMGEHTVEVWENVGGAGFPFARSASGFIELGIVAPYSAAKLDNSIFWLASDLTVRRMNGYTPLRVSQHGVEQAIRGYSTVADAQAETYTYEGHLFYVLTFPTERKTWVFDATVGEWHERESYRDTRWCAAWVKECYGRVLVGCYDSGEIGEMRSDVYAEWSDPIISTWTYAPIYQDGRQGYHAKLEVFAEPGVGLTTGQGSDPLVMLEVSDDGGISFRHETTRTLGKIGEYQRRASWARLGRSNNRVYRMSCSDPVRLVVADTQFEADFA